MKLFSPLGTDFAVDLHLPVLNQYLCLHTGVHQASKLKSLPQFNKLVSDFNCIHKNSYLAALLKLTGRMR